MSEFVVALPMYEWPQTRAETDAEWARLREVLRAAGVDAPEKLARRNADLPPVPGGIRDGEGRGVAPDPATLPPDELDFHALWLHPKLLLAQTCWGPMEQGLGEHVRVVGQPSYDGIEGGRGALYSSAILTRKGDRSAAWEMDVQPPDSGVALIPLERLRSRRFAYNGTDSMSGMIALSRDLEAAGSGMAIFSEVLETGAHRASALAVANRFADVCAVDCRSWQLIRRFEKLADSLEVVGWTALRKGLPYIASAKLPDAMLDAMRQALAQDLQDTPKAAAVR